MTVLQCAEGLARRHTYLSIVLFSLKRAQRREFPMRTNLNSVVTNRNVFGYRQDRAVSSLNDGSCARAAQHLASWHASKHARHEFRARVCRGIAGMAGAVLKAKPMCLAVTGPQGQPVRRTSPVLVTG
jgi:hypothetical protein